MTTKPRKFDSEIRINDKGEWIFRGQTITQENILDFFKSNIKEDDLGIYITNSYGEFTEHGYLEVESIFLKIVNYTKNEKSVFFIAEDNSNSPTTDFNFFTDPNEKIFCMKKNQKFIKFYFNRQTLNFISEIMLEDNGNYFLNLPEGKIPITPYTKPIKVNLPDEFKT